MEHDWSLLAQYLSRGTQCSTKITVSTRVLYLNLVHQGFNDQRCDPSTAVRYRTEYNHVRPYVYGRTVHDRGTVMGSKTARRRTRAGIPRYRTNLTQSDIVIQLLHSA